MSQVRSRLNATRRPRIGGSGIRRLRISTDANWLRTQFDATSTRLTRDSTRLTPPNARFTPDSSQIHPGSSQESRDSAPYLTSVRVRARPNRDFLSVVDRTDRQSLSARSHASKIQPRPPARAAQRKARKRTDSEPQARRGELLLSPVHGRTRHRAFQAPGVSAALVSGSTRERPLRSRAEEAARTREDYDP